MSVVVIVLVSSIASACVPIRRRVSQEGVFLLLLRRDGYDWCASATLISPLGFGESGRMFLPFLLQPLPIDEWKIVISVGKTGQRADLRKETHFNNRSYGKPRNLICSPKLAPSLRGHAFAAGGSSGRHHVPRNWRESVVLSIVSFDSAIIIKCTWGWVG